MLFSLNVNDSNHHKKATALNIIAVAIISPLFSMSLSLLLAFMKIRMAQNSYLRSNQAFIVM